MESATMPEIGDKAVKAAGMRLSIQRSHGVGEIGIQGDGARVVKGTGAEENEEQTHLSGCMIDLESVPLEEVFQNLHCTKEGLTFHEAELRMQLVGPNKLEEQRENLLLKFFSFMWNPLSWIMELAALMALVLDNGENLLPDWQDFVGIICLLLINSTVSYIEETSAGQAAAALMQALALKAKVLRDKVYSEVDASILVPGDIISIKLGDIIPADARLLDGDPLTVDQSALTGESVAVIKKPGDEVFSGSICKQGEIEAVVIATGAHTFFGKAAHLVDTTHQQGHFHQVLKSIGNFCIMTIALGMFIEIIVMYPVQRRKYRVGVENLLILLIGGIPIAMPTVLSVTMAVGSHSLAKQGAITKRITAIEEMAGMDILCSDKTGTLTLNRLTVDKHAIEVLSPSIDKDAILLTAARASRIENQDAIDLAICNMLADPKEAREGVEEVHFLPFNPTNKRTAMTYKTLDGKMHRATKGAPEQILELAHDKETIFAKVHEVINRFADRGLRSLGVAKQEVPDGVKESPGGPWQMLGIIPLFDPPRHDTSDTVHRALELGVNIKMITGDQLAIAKETGQRLGMGTNMYPSTALFGHGNHSQSLVGVDEGELIEQADGFAGVFPEHKYKIVKVLQEKKHVVGMTGDGVNDAPALKKADIGIAVADATDAARNAADIVLTQPGLSVIIHAILTSRCIFQRMKNYTIYAVSITIRIVVGFTVLALIWRFDFSPFMVLMIAILNDGTIMTISKDIVIPSRFPDSWKLRELFIQGIFLGGYQALMTVVFFYLVHCTNFFQKTCGASQIRENPFQETAVVYLQVSIVSQGLIFVTRSHGWSFMERPGFWLLGAFVVAQLMATLVAVYASWDFAKIQGCGWKWAGIVWVYDVIWYFPLDPIKMVSRYMLSGQAWTLMTEHKVFLTHQKNYGREQRQAQWATIALSESYKPQNIPSLGLKPLTLGQGSGVPTDLKRWEVANQARRRAEIARLREHHTLKGHVEAWTKLKGLDEIAMQQAYTL